MLLLAVVKPKRLKTLLAARKILPYFDPIDAVEVFDLVNRQDWEVCELTQLSMTSKAFRSGGVYVPVALHIRAFADFIEKTLSS